MANDLVQRVLAVFAAVAADGGDGVLRALRGDLAELAPFDDGELAVNLATDLHRRALGEHATPLLAEELLTQLGPKTALVRIDDARQSGPWPHTREALVRHQLRSLLALPIAIGGVARGALALATHRPCGFAGAPIHTLQPLVDAGGLALKQALKLSALRDELEPLRRTTRELTAALDARDEALLAARAANAARAAEHAALAAMHERKRDALARRVDEAEVALGELNARLAAALSEQATPIPGAEPKAASEAEPACHAAAPQQTSAAVAAQATTQASKPERHNGAGGAPLAGHTPNAGRRRR